MTPAPASPLSAPPRVAAIDAYRGLVMFLMLAEVLRLAAVAKALPDSEVWRFLAHHQTHVEWGGCTLHDLIQPSFSFLVGVALPFSLASRASRGQSFARRTVHALWRAVVLVLLGVFLRSVGQTQTFWTFTDTLSQIGLGYYFLFLLGHVRPRWQWLAFGVILVGYWAAFAVYEPDPPDPARTGVKADWAHHPDGFLAHWDKNTNPAAAFDRWFLNLLPRKETFAFERGGYTTLSFIPTLATMILGLIAGGWLQRAMPAKGKLLLLFGTGLAMLGAGLGAEAAGVCPVVKRIWTPAWVLFSGCWCFLILGAFYLLTDCTGYAGWTFPLRVIGANSIFIYCLAHLIEPFILKSFQTHLGADVFKVYGPQYEPVVGGAAVLVVFWVLLLWMYQRRIFLRI